MAQLLQSVSHALAILRLLQERSELGVTEIAKALGVGPSTAHRLLATLADAGFVSQSHPGSKYALGPAMHAGRSALEQLHDIASPHMAALRDVSRETVHLAVLRSTETHFVSAFESPRIMRVTSRVGQTLPAHVTAAGKLLLAERTNDEVRELYGDQALSGGTAGEPRPLEDLVSELDTVRATGYGRNLAESEAGVAALAIVLRAPGGEALGSLTVTGPDSLFNPGKSAELSARETELLAMLGQTADLIHSELAATAAPSLHRKS